MAIKLITGLKEVEDIEAQDDGARIYGTVSSFDKILDVGGKFDYQIISNNSVRIKDGEALMQGRHVRQAPNTYENMTINNGAQNMYRNDLIVLRYTKNSSTGIENVELAVLEGSFSSSEATDPEVTTGDIFKGCLIHEMPLYRVSLSGLNITSVMKLFYVLEKYDGHTHSPSDIKEVIPISKGGTGATTADVALRNLSGTPYEVKNGSDFNTMTKPGIYTMRSSSMNSPSGSYTGLIVNKSDTGNYVHQIAIKESSYDMYLRYLNGSSWSSWKKTALNENVPVVETGTWSPVVCGYSTDVYFNVLEAKYYKIGNLVNVSCRLKISGHSGDNQASQIRGLPFAATTGAVGNYVADTDTNYYGADITGAVGIPTGATYGALSGIGTGELVSKPYFIFSIDYKI